MFAHIKEFQTIFVALLGLAVAVWFNWSKIRLDAEAFKRELFLKYNSRYNDLNDALESLLHREFEIDRDSQVDGDLTLDEVWAELFEGEPTKTPEFISVGFDYVNLCAEEYYWFRKGFIDPEVWRCWCSGMVQWYNDSRFLQKIVERERKRSDPYYNSDFLTLFAMNPSP